MKNALMTMVAILTFVAIIYMIYLAVGILASP